MILALLFIGILTSSACMAEEGWGVFSGRIVVEGDVSPREILIKTGAISIFGNIVAYGLFFKVNCSRTIVFDHSLLLISRYSRVNIGAK